MIADSQYSDGKIRMAVEKTVIPYPCAQCSPGFSCCGYDCIDRFGSRVENENKKNQPKIAEWNCDHRNLNASFFFLAFLFEFWDKPARKNPAVSNGLVAHYSFSPIRFSFFNG